MNKRNLTVSLMLVFVILLGSFSSIIKAVELENIEEKVIENSKNIKVEIPVLKNLKDKTEEAKLNRQIETNAKNELQTFKDEIKKIDDSELNISYMIRSTDKYLSFYIEVDKNVDMMAHDEVKREYYTIDLETGKLVTLEELFDYSPDYKFMVNNQIREYIENDKENYYDGKEAFITIKDNQDFYIDRNKNIRVVFDKYEIAPGSTGFPEFIVTKEIAPTKYYYSKNYNFKFTLPPAWDKKVRVVEDKNITRFIYTPENPIHKESEIFKIEAVENYKESKEDIVLGKDGKCVYVGKVIYSDIYDKDTTEKERYDVARDVLDGVEQLFEIDKNLNKLDVVLLNGKEYKLKDRIIKDENGTRFIPVAEVLRELGYKVEWNQKNFVVTSRKGNVESQIYTRENRYSINKALVILKDKAILKNGRTYVPVEYFSDVLNLDTSLVNNTLSIKTK